MGVWNYNEKNGLKTSFIWDNMLVTPSAVRCVSAWVFRLKLILKGNR
jgi:hypothetical protein